MKQIAATSIILTEKCNLSCSFCYEKPKNAAMSKDTVEKCVDLIAAMQNQNRLHIMWFGGEPLLNWETLFHGLKYAEAKLPQDILTNLITTNGTLWDEEIKQKFLEHPNAGIQISWQGLPGLQDTYRGMSAVVEKNVHEMASVLPNKIHVQMQLLPGMVDKIAEAVDYVNSVLGERNGFIVLRPVPEMEGWNETNLDVLKAQLKVVFEKYGRKIKKLLDCHYGYDAEDLFCAPGRNFCSFTPNGDIYPCHRFYFTGEEKFKLGNVYSGLSAETNISRMLDGLNRYSIAGCEGCEGEKYCYICPACNYEQTGNPLISNERVCSVNKVYGGQVAEYVKNHLTEPRQYSVIMPEVVDIKEILPKLLEIINNFDNSIGILHKKCRNMEGQIKFINKDWE